MYESNSWYSVYYHYMHYYPRDIVKLEIPGNLMERTLELLKKDPIVIIGEIKKIEKERLR